VYALGLQQTQYIGKSAMKSFRRTDEATTRQLVSRNVQFAFGAAILTLLVIGFISYRGMVVSSESQRWVQHTQRVLNQLTGLLLSIENIETSYRAFALTGEESNLKSYPADILTSKRREATLRSLTVDNPTQQLQMPNIERLVAQKIQLGELVIGLRRTRGAQAAEDAIRDGQGTQTAEELRGVVRQLQQEELRLLALRSDDAKRRLRQTKTILILGTILGLLINIAAAWSVQRESSRREFAEKALKESEEKFRGLLEAAPDAMVVSQSGEIVLINVQAEKQFGYRREELLHRPIEILLPNPFRIQDPTDQNKDVISPRVREGGAGVELFGLRKDGSEFPVEIMVSPVENATGVLMTTAIRDITIRKKFEEQLAQTAVELKRSNEELQQFASVASHDLQEPLRVVASYTQLLAKRYKGQLDAEADEFIGYAVDGCTRMQGLIQDLLTYSRAGTKGKALREISGEKILKEVLTNLGTTIVESGATVTHDSLPTITTDDTQLVQVFQNLVGNAIKYRSAATPHVHVSAAKNGGNEWIFSVRDNGLGIDPKYFERIFILFQRLHGRQDYEGTGIGLAICKKIVERLGGRIWVESQLENGSTFYFALPETGGK
jgi:PAS domain S-box-containing protein